MRTNVLARKLPKSVKTPLKRARFLVRKAQYRGDDRLCPVCGTTSREFLPFGSEARPGAACPHCRSLERHRLLWLFLQSRTDLFDGRPRTMLHVAPEECLASRFRAALGDGYLTADLDGSKAMVAMDITDIRYPDESFDVICCSHVLEHVQDDRRAMREFHRTLKKDGWAILLVPIGAERTFEDPSVTDPDERTRLFGQFDHVRLYGRDYVDRLREAGFAVEVVEADELAGPDDRVRMGLGPACGEIYLCTR